MPKSSRPARSAVRQAEPAPPTESPQAEPEPPLAERARPAEEPAADEPAAATPASRVEPEASASPASAGAASSDATPRASQLGNVSVVGLFVLAVFYTIYAAQTIIMPLVLAAIIKLLLAPAVYWMRRRAGIPYPFGAALVLVGLLGAMAFAGRELITPARSMVANAPHHLEVLEHKLEPLRAPLAKLGDATERLRNLADAPVDDDDVRHVIEQPATGLHFLVDQGSQLGITAILVIMLSFFLLASGQVFLGKLVQVMPSFKQKRRVVEIVHQIEGEISRYLLAITLINATLGTVVGIGFWALGLPEPFLWGVVVALVNFIPYVGPMVGIALVAVMSIVHFDGVVAMMLPPGLYLAVNTLEAYLFTPLILGRSLSLSAVVVLAAVMVWTWLWGIVGAVLAVPLLVIIKTVCSKVESWQFVATFLSSPRRAP